MTLILASASPIRKSLLENAGLSPKVVPARVDEDTIKASMIAEGAPPRDIADRLADAKAMKVSMKSGGELVLGSDQILALGREVFSKCDSAEDAKSVLMQLRGKTHNLYSAAVLYRDSKPIWRHVGVVRLTMRKFSDSYLESYLDRNWPEVAYSVGCYHLEGEGVRLFSNIQGDYFSVLGLPLIELLSYLTTAGVIEE